MFERWETADRPSNRWREQSQCFFDLADALPTAVIQVQCLHSCPADGSQAFNLEALEPEVLVPKLPDRVE
jgi:hypothetical protein